MLSREEAKKLLTEAGEINPGKWVEHSLNVGTASERLAEHLNLDKEKAYIYGILHDIGRIRKGIGVKHIIDGYHYMMELGYPDIARYCLTHTFFIKDVHSSCALWDVTDEEANEIQEFLDSHEYDLYDKIIQISDCIGDAEGITTVERRLIDVHLRKGVDENTIKTWNEIFSLQAELEELLGSSMYSIFPEVGNNISNKLIKNCLTLNNH